jgi:predicted secreted protein
VIAVLVNALIFMAMHLLNPGVTTLALAQLFLFGVLASLMIYYFDSLWAAIWMHTGWNFTQSIIFGLPNSGIVSKYSVFKLEAASARDGIFYNTSFGVEGSLGANVMIAAVIVIVLIYGLATKRGERMDHWAEAEKRDAGKNHYWEAVILTIIMVAVIVGGYFTVKWVNDHAEEIQQVIEESQQAETAQEAEPAQGPETPAQEGQQAEPAQEPEAPAQEGQQAEPPQEQTAPAQDGQQAEPAQDGQQTAPEEQQAAPAQDDQQAAPEEQQAEPAQEPVQSNL